MSDIISKLKTNYKISHLNNYYLAHLQWDGHYYVYININNHLFLHYSWITDDKKYFIDPISKSKYIIS